MKRAIAILLLGPLLSGCGTFVARTGWRNECSRIPRYYPATAVDAQLIAGPFIPHNYDASELPKAAASSVVGIIDVPISLVSDTVCIPLDIWKYEPRQ